MIPLVRCSTLVTRVSRLPVLFLWACSAPASPAPSQTSQSSYVPEISRVRSERPRPVEASELEVAPEPEPEPPLFAEMQRVPVSALWTELEAIARDMERNTVIADEYAELVHTHALEDTPALFRDYVRVKLAFEATRDGGFWRLRWAITNRSPNSKEIWSQWRARTDVADDEPTAVAECDELSALFAVVARRLGVDRVGLLWPVWNHVVAVWTVRGADGRDVRLVVPTSQIFLDAQATLGTDGFNPWKQKTIYTYRSRDVSDGDEVPAPLARFFVEEARKHATRPAAELQRLRNHRSARLGGS
jgi:hypothetical protein